MNVFKIVIVDSFYHFTACIIVHVAGDRGKMSSRTIIDYHAPFDQVLRREKLNYKTRWAPDKMVAMGNFYPSYLGHLNLPGFELWPCLFH